MHPLFKKADELSHEVIGAAIDILVEDCLLLELESVHEILPVHKAQLLSYMKLLNIPIGLIFNFHELKLTEGISRMILPKANQ